MLWSAYRIHGALPYPGGLLDQPLWFLVHCTAIDTVFDARQELEKDGASMNDLSGEAIRMISWLDGSYLSKRKDGDHADN